MEKKLKCPYCGRSMELKNGKTLDYWYSCTECDVDTPTARGRALAYQRAVEWTLAVLGTCDALSDALGIRKTHPMENVPLETLLGEVKKLQQTLGNRVLTLEELKSAETPVWLEYTVDGKSYIKPVLVYSREVADSCCSYLPCVVLVFRSGDMEDCLISSYNRDWRCWLRKPSLEEMGAVAWKEGAEDGED